jgi:hypothetical protein
VETSVQTFYSYCVYIRKFVKLFPQHTANKYLLKEINLAEQSVCVCVCVCVCARARARVDEEEPIGTHLYLTENLAVRPTVIESRQEPKWRHKQTYREVVAS